MSSLLFPDTYFGPGGVASTLKHDIRREASRIRPSGELGLSHWFKTALFDHLNRLASRVFDPVGVTRYWRVIGTVGVGKTDWGLFIDDRLVAIAELKPNRVSGTGPMVDWIG